MIRASKFLDVLEFIQALIASIDLIAVKKESISVIYKYIYNIYLLLLYIIL